MATAWPIDSAPPEYVTPVPALRCARTSAALGPVYVITPVELLYARDPSPPASVTLIAPRASESVYNADPASSVPDILSPVPSVKNLAAPA